MDALVWVFPRYDMKPSQAALNAAREALEGSSEAYGRFVSSWLAGRSEEAIEALAEIIEEAYTPGKDYDIPQVIEMDPDTNRR